MKIRILKNLAAILISLCILESCSDTKVFWTDLRTNRSEEKFEISFFNEKNDKIKYVPFVCNKTKSVNIPKDYIPNGWHNAANLGVNYLIDYDKKMMEIFLMDHDSYNVIDYKTSLEKKENVYAYDIMFIDENERKLCTIVSKDNVFSVDKKDILPTSTAKSPTEIMEQLPKSDVAYFFETDGYDRVENFQRRYLVKGKFFNHFFWISPNLNGPISYYILDESLPYWLKDEL